MPPALQTIESKPVRPRFLGDETLPRATRKATSRFPWLTHDPVAPSTARSLVFLSVGFPHARSRSDSTSSTGSRSFAATKRAESPTRCADNQADVRATRALRSEIQEFRFRETGTASRDSRARPASAPAGQERTDNLIVITPDERIDVRRSAQDNCKPRQQLLLAWHQNAARLGIKGVQVEPVQRLRHRDCRDGTRRQTGRSPQARRDIPPARWAEHSRSGLRSRRVRSLSEKTRPAATAAWPLPVAQSSAELVVWRRRRHECKERPRISADGTSRNPLPAWKSDP